MRQSTTLVAALILSGVALLVMLFATQTIARAEPEAPQTTIVIDTMRPANAALKPANDGDVIHVRCAVSFPIVPSADV
ncbi:MAG: hypothetical protein U0559_04970 [Anaerolineae bacterium]